MTVRIFNCPYDLSIRIIKYIFWLFHSGSELDRAECYDRPGNCVLLLEHNMQTPFFKRSIVNGR